MPEPPVHRDLHRHEAEDDDASQEIGRLNSRDAADHTAAERPQSDAAAQGAFMQTAGASSVPAQASGIAVIQTGEIIVAHQNRQSDKAGDKAGKGPGREEEDKTRDSHRLGDQRKGETALPETGEVKQEVDDDDDSAHHGENGPVLCGGHSETESQFRKEMKDHAE